MPDESTYRYLSRGWWLVKVAATFHGLAEASVSNKLAVKKSSLYIEFTRHVLVFGLVKPRNYTSRAPPPTEDDATPIDNPWASSAIPRLIYHRSEARIGINAITRAEEFLLGPIRGLSTGRTGPIACSDRGSRFPWRGLPGLRSRGS